MEENIFPEKGKNDEGQKIEKREAMRRKRQASKVKLQVKINKLRTYSRPGNSTLSALTR